MPILELPRDIICNDRTSNNAISISTISANLTTPRRSLAVMIEALSLRMDVELAVDLAGDVMMALRIEGLKMVRDEAGLLERRRAGPAL
jgi:hypothetical protein